VEPAEGYTISAFAVAGRMSCQRRVMPFKVLIWPLFMFVTTVSSQQRSLSQADGPGIYNKPLSATPEDLLNDPSGRAHLLVR